MAHVLSSYFCGLFEWNPNQFLSDTERAHRGYSPIYVKFISWKVSQAVLDSIIRAYKSRQNNISASQKYSDKLQKRMSRLLITRREFKDDEKKVVERAMQSVNGQKVWGLKFQDIW